MPKKPKPRPRPKAKLTQKERFIQAAKDAGADETGAEFIRALKKIVPAKKRD